MKELTFATGNPRKMQEANETLAEYGIRVTPVHVAIDEIQHRDSAEIAKAKARAAYAAAGTPVVVSDTTWEIPALGGFPGGYMKDVSSWLKPEDWLALMDRYEDKTIYCHEHIAFCDGDEVRHFASVYRGEFVSEARGSTDVGDSIEHVVALYGGMTLAEYLERGEVASAGEELLHWKQFAEWYVRH